VAILLVNVNNITRPPVKRPGNVFFSPISAHAVLSVAYQEAQGPTLEAFGKSLDVPNHPAAAIGYKDIINHLINVSDVQLLKYMSCKDTLLPNQRNGIKELERKLTETDLSKVTENHQGIGKAKCLMGDSRSIL